MAADHRFHLDQEQSEKAKRQRERHFHAVEVPLLRVIGFSMITLLVLLRYVFVPDSGDAHALWIGIIGLAYSLVAWAVLYVGFAALRPRVNLGTVFLALDVFVFIVAIYLTGGDRSWDDGRKKGGKGGLRTRGGDAGSDWKSKKGGKNRHGSGPHAFQSGNERQG